VEGQVTIYVVSDSIGETAEQVALAAGSQFNSHIKDIKRIPFIIDKDHINEVLERASKENSIIVFTMVVPELRNYLIEEARIRNIPTIDVMGPVMDAIILKTGANPRYEPGLVRKLNEKYFKRIEAVEFAVKYDDGKDPRGAKIADVVLIGVSRTSKTPLCMYLAHKNIKAANIPLVPEIDPPKELFEIPSYKIIGLTINPLKLNEIRKERLKALGLGVSANYANMERILQELDFAEKVMKKLGCKIIDVSNKAVEETASIIMEYLKEVSQ